jgi:hypothetical protein
VTSKDRDIEFSVYVVSDAFRSGAIGRMSPAKGRPAALRALQRNMLLNKLNDRNPLRLRALAVAWKALPLDVDFSKLGSLICNGAHAGVRWEDESRGIAQRISELEQWERDNPAIAKAVKKAYVAALAMTGNELICHRCNAVLWRKFGGFWPPSSEAEKRCITAGCESKRSDRGVRPIHLLPRGPSRAAANQFLASAQSEFPMLSLYYDLSGHPYTVRPDGAKVARRMHGLDEELGPTPGLKSAKGQMLHWIKGLIGPVANDAIPHLLVYACGLGDLGRVARGSRIGKQTDEEFIAEFEKRSSQS